MEKENNDFKPLMEYKVIWYKSEFAWLLISLVWQVILFFLIGQSIISESYIWVMFIGTAYTAYFIIKGIIYAWIINPKQWYIKKWKQLLSFFKS